MVVTCDDEHTCALKMTNRFHFTARVLYWHEQQYFSCHCRPPMETYRKCIRTECLHYERALVYATHSEAFAGKCLSFVNFIFLFFYYRSTHFTCMCLESKRQSNKRKKETYTQFEYHDVFWSVKFSHRQF